MGGREEEKGGEENGRSPVPQARPAGNWVGRNVRVERAFGDWKLELLYQPFLGSSSKHDHFHLRFTPLLPCPRYILYLVISPCTYRLVCSVLLCGKRKGRYVCWLARGGASPLAAMCIHHPDQHNSTRPLLTDVCRSLHAFETSS